MRGPERKTNRIRARTMMVERKSAGIQTTDD